MPPLIECVPNFSEGRNLDVIRQITDQVESVEGATLLHVDPGKATNRTVVTFAGAPDAVVEAAFRAIAKAAELIDMRHHTGEHPRMGATDVCPLVPVSGITMEETAALARQLAERVGRELGIPVYLYEAAQPDPARKNLAVIRAGEYEGLARKMADPAWRPDFGPATFNPKSGATVIGARDFLVAYNVNLNTTSTRRANAIAFDVREAGRPKREGNPLTGKVVTDASGDPVMIPGTLKAVKAIGWYIEEYGVAQVSMNLTDIRTTPLHVAFDEVCRAAEARGVRVTGSELVGLVPLSCLLDAGRHYLRRQQRSLGVSEQELVKIAIKSLGLSELAPFVPGGAGHRVPAARRRTRSTRRPDGAGLRRRDGLGIGGAGRRFGVGAGRRPRRVPRRDGGQPLLAQARLGRALGGVLALGGTGAAAQGGAAPAGGRGHPRLQPGDGGAGHAEGHRCREGGALRRAGGGQPRRAQGALRSDARPRSRASTCSTRWRSRATRPRRPMPGWAPSARGRRSAGPGSTCAPTSAE